MKESFRQNQHFIMCHDEIFLDSEWYTITPLYHDTAFKGLPTLCVQWYTTTQLYHDIAFMGLPTLCVQWYTTTQLYHDIAFMGLPTICVERTVHRHITNTLLPRVYLHCAQRYTTTPLYHGTLLSVVYQHSVFNDTSMYHTTGPTTDQLVLYTITPLYQRTDFKGLSTLSSMVHHHITLPWHTAFMGLPTLCLQ